MPVYNKPHTYHFILPFMLVGICMFGIYVDYWYFLLLTVPILYFLNNQIHIKKILGYLLIVTLILIVGIFAHNFNLWKFFSAGVDHLLHFSLKNSIQHYVSHNYDATTSNFINLVLFNVKDDNAKTTYYHMVDLSIVYLIVVSGFHISIFRRIVNFVLHKNLKSANITNAILITFYCYLLGFATSVTRVLLMFLIGWIFQKKLKNRIDVLGVAGLITMMVAPACVFNIGFCMSYLCTLVILLIYKMEISNVLLEKLFINIAATLVSLPFLIHMQKQISLWVILNSFIFSYVFATIFVYFLLTFWIIWIGVVQHALVLAINYVINASWENNVVIHISDWSPLIRTGYFIVFYLGIIMLKSYKFS